MSSKVLAFINLKGGVGKTATVVNIGAKLRRIANVNGIRFTANTTRQRLAALIRRYAQRAAVHVAPHRVPSRKLKI